MNSDYSVNGLKDFDCAICYDSTCESIKLDCGHAFGRLCIRKWIERSNQIDCPTCQRQLTDENINEIKKASLWERAVSIPIKSTIFLCHAILMLTPPASPSAFVGLSVGGAGTVVAGVAGMPFGPFISAAAATALMGIWSMSESERATSVVPGIVTGVATGMFLGAGGAAALASGAAVSVVLEATGGYLQRNY